MGIRFFVVVRELIVGVWSLGIFSFFFFRWFLIILILKGIIDFRRVIWVGIDLRYLEK